MHVPSLNNLKITLRHDCIQRKTKDILWLCYTYSHAYLAAVLEIIILATYSCTKMEIVGISSMITGSSRLTSWHALAIDLDHRQVRAASPCMHACSATIDGFRNYKSVYRPPRDRQAAEFNIACYMIVLWICITPMECSGN